MTDGTCMTCHWWQPCTFEDDHRKHLGGQCVLAMYKGEALEPAVITNTGDEPNCHAVLFTTPDFGCNWHNRERTP